jgi:hypothetical protein
MTDENSRHFCMVVMPPEITEGRPRPHATNGAGIDHWSRRNTRTHGFFQSDSYTGFSGAL